MTTIFWLLLFAIAAGLAVLVRHNLRKWDERKQAEEERFATFMKGTTGAAKADDQAILPAPLIPAATPGAALPVAASGLAQQKMLFEAAHKAGGAGGHALAIQLYARLLARYPATTLAIPARDAVAAQKKKLLKEQ